MSPDIPKECNGCQLRGMAAVDCIILIEVPMNAHVQCLDVHTDPDVRNTAGGKFTGSAPAQNHRVPGSGIHDNTAGRRMGRKPR